MGRRGAGSCFVRPSAPPAGASTRAWARGPSRKKTMPTRCPPCPQRARSLPWRPPPPRPRCGRRRAPASPWRHRSAPSAPPTRMGPPLQTRPGPASARAAAPVRGRPHHRPRPKCRIGQVTTQHRAQPRSRAAVTSGPLACASKGGGTHGAVDSSPDLDLRAPSAWYNTFQHEYTCARSTGAGRVKRLCRVCCVRRISCVTFYGPSPKPPVASGESGRPNYRAIPHFPPPQLELFLGPQRYGNRDASE